MPEQKKRVRRGPQTRGKSARRPDPVELETGQSGWDKVVNGDHARFDYHFWPEGVGYGTLSYALELGWVVCEAEAPNAKGALRVRGGHTAKPGEPIRGVHGQILCRREKRLGKRFADQRKAFVASLESRLGQDPVTARALHQEMVGSDVPGDHEGLSTVGIESREELIVGDDPYPAFQEQG